MAMPTGAELLRELDKEQAALENLLKLRDKVKAAGIKEKHLKYERLDQCGNQPSEPGAPDNSSQIHFSAMTRPRGPSLAASDLQHHAIE